MIATRFRQIGLLLFAIAISGIAFFQLFARVYNGFPANLVTVLVVVAVLFIVLWALLLKFQPYASQEILPCVMLLTAIGTMMIARIDYAKNTDVAFRQLIWACVALVLTCIFIIALRDYRVLRRFSYVSMVVGLALLLSPMIPGIGKEIGGARIWIGFGSHTLQPGEFAKLFLAFFFAAYLFNHRDQLAVGGKKVVGLQLPRMRDMGPLILIWFASIGVLVVQHDLGTSLMFFAMFVSMLYVATGRGSWLIIGGIAFVVAAVFSVKVFAHVGYRVDGWLHPFDAAVYNRKYGSSYQLVTGLFGLASGGLLGTGIGQGHPGLTPLGNSDFIYSSLGEELGLTGLLAILMLYLIIITSGLLTAMKIKDGFGKLLASGLVFTMAFQVFTVVGGLTLVIPMTGLTMPYMAAGGSSLVANYILAALLIVISNEANKPEPDGKLSNTMQYEAMEALNQRSAQKKRSEAEHSRAHARFRAANTEPATSSFPATMPSTPSPSSPRSTASAPQTGPEIDYSPSKASSDSMSQETAPILQAAQQPPSAQSGPRVASSSTSEMLPQTPGPNYDPNEASPSTGTPKPASGDINAAGKPTNMDNPEIPNLSFDDLMGGKQ
ncbi:FtsW/RodA/SpoVE family cell cycle protein [Bifidobacterium sp. ESL0690]|uniref:FtsW/RodA/SpoVE family cell cycle protein n=1 Tax=Bifidobacterium sp. ESL0690 TaxID=2983214 RepID=UPI0023F6F25F|nr:FtsW/RodA/SpoVE family cell cycle protein [Bifidobacterium sp. ESL0690]WEV46705.1 FtsW/RodA/SpoVE family cell cycle protein [Bifidobacterium sp. ESL0690]